MLRIGVCNETLSESEQLEKHLKAWAHQRSAVVQVMRFQSGEDLLFEIEASGDFELVFIDTALSGMDGIETALEVRRGNRLTGIVLMSSCVQYFNEMYCLYPAQLVPKSITRRKVFEAMERFMEEKKYFHEDFHFCFNHHSYIIDLREVLYFVSEGRAVRIFLETGKKYTVYARLDMVESTLKNCKNHFIRIHQSYLVNGRQIERYYCKRVMLRNKAELPVSRKRKGEILRFYAECEMPRLKMS